MKNHKILARLRNGERIDHYETVRLTKDGQRLNISLTISPSSRCGRAHRRRFENRARYYCAKSGGKRHSRSAGAIAGLRRHFGAARG